MVEYLKVLQIPGIDLEKYIEEEMRENPMLERDVPESSVPLDSSSAHANSELDFIYSKGFKITGGSGSSQLSSDEKGAAEKALQFIRKKTSLKEYLLRQLSEMDIDQIHRKITSFMIESLNEDGYLRESTRDIESILRVDRKDVRSSLKILHSMEPSGVGARNLKECLIIQLARKRLLNVDNRNIIVFYFEQLVRKNYSEISKKTGISVKIISSFHDMIKKLNPKPGSSFMDNGWETYVVPDLILIETDDGYTVQYNDEVAPPVRINNYYRNLLKDPNSTPETKEYIKKSFSRAASFLKAIEQRKQTILDTACFIVDYQKEFLKTGNENLRPLTMRVVAEGIGISESTVSRAVNGKYIQTPRGALELKSFFSSRLGEEDEKNISGVGAMDMIKKIISNENKLKPLSDEQIRLQLDSRGIKIARRTIAKYREEMGIQTASLRKS